MHRQMGPPCALVLVLVQLASSKASRYMGHGPATHRIWGTGVVRTAAEYCPARKRTDVMASRAMEPAGHSSAAAAVA